MRDRKPVYGWGINDAPYVVRKAAKVDGKQKQIWICPYYSRWSDMVKRCHCAKIQEASPTYKGVTVHEDWKSFMNFRKWMMKQDWKGKHLDKDLALYGNKEYSEDACIFISSRVNNFLVKNDAIRGEYPMGVYYAKKTPKMRNEYKNPYVSQVKIGVQGKRLVMGHHPTPHQAHRAWQLGKIAVARDIIKEQTDERVIQGLNRVIDKIQSDYDNNLETIDF